ncbi:sarcoplasmic reticulum histidine-rich calcium-binding protein isoform X2 [Centropristis striata]|uniref:sarcoplasmic reticulum histidine-rich calcium-binding protein isoform X2 n=1 Tax=Centropristis striata TaxID=184440 RepID=UPI0027DFEEC4|nr:sarcoplasmic reticulum histidine-rich calcium-binding protein isoform X2 [Centropristis striata]
MRPTTSTMLQQNNNNNYPCLSVSGSTGEMLQKCSRTSLPFPSRLELGLGDLPLIRGLRAWALCSKNRRKAGGMLGGGQAPTAPPAGREGSTSCPRPADVYLSGEWGRMGYGLPLGLDARQAGIGALVTVATLKTSEGSGKTQTQCLFLRTEKGSCLYSTAKPGAGGSTSAASSVVGGWLRGKTGGGGGGGGRDISAGRRDNGPTLPAHTGVNRVRVRSGRRWRKSSHAAAREKTGVSRERQQSHREDPAREISLEERQEERDKGGLASKQFPSPQQDSRRGRQEKDGACRSPRCCHNAAPKTCSQCGRRAQRRESQEEHEGGNSKGMRKDRQKNEEEEKGGLSGLESSNSALASPNPDPESNRFHPESLISGCDADEIREAESSEEMKTQTCHSEDDYSEREEDTNCEVIKIQTGDSGQVTDGFTSSQNRDFNDRSEETAANVNGFSDHVEADEESERDMERVGDEEGEGRINQTPAERYQDVSVSTCPASISTAASPEPSVPAGGSTCRANHDSCGVQREPESSREDELEESQQGVAEPEIMGKGELHVSTFEQQQQQENCVADKNNTVNEDRNRKPQFCFQDVGNSSEPEEREASASPLRHRDASVVTGNGCNSSTTELNGAERRDENREEVSQGEDILNPEEDDDEAGEVSLRREWTCNGLHDKEQHTEDDVNDIQEGNDEDVTRRCTLKDNWRLEESAGGGRGTKEESEDTCEANGETSSDVTNVDPSTSPARSPANPALSLHPLGSCLEEEEEEEEEEGVEVPAGDGKGGQDGKGRQVEVQGEKERGSTVATEEGRKEEEEEEKGEEEKEEDEFGVFMQAEGEPAWSEGRTMSASVPCGSRESALGNHAISGESTHWTPGWTDSSFHQSSDSWTAFPQDSSDGGREAAAGQWWPTSALEENRDSLLANQNLASVFAEAFPSLSSADPCDHDTVPTLTQLLRARAGQDQDQGLLDSFHDLNKMICQRYKRATGVSRDLLLRTLHLEQQHTDSRPAPWTANRRLSPGLPSANQHAQNTAAKRRLSYDYNRNIVE